MRTLFCRFRAFVLFKKIVTLGVVRIERSLEYSSNNAETALERLDEFFLKGTHKLYCACNGVWHRLNLRFSQSNASVMSKNFALKAPQLHSFPADCIFLMRWFESVQVPPIPVNRALGKT